ncbi:hypothetical protein AB0J83_38400 [Actinoplanes sp. NPDC049596]|uniref:hypothetical protein n=1 Tax=unclassified Actinoplanes TaxID=2626549 RepID=UPI0034215354
MPDDAGLHEELMALRNRRGVERPGIGAELGPGLRALSGVLASDHDLRVRHKVVTLLERLLTDLPPDLRQAARLAFAIDRDHRYPTLQERVGQLAELQSCAPRTARRLMDRALHEMVTAAAGFGAGTLEAGTGPGWRATSLSALFRLDTPTPELYEMRRIVATRDLDEVTVRLGLPRTPPGEVRGELVVDALFGARVTKVTRVEHQPERNYYRVDLALPGTVATDQEHEIWLRVVLPPGQPTWNHYAIVPLNPCETGSVRVRFHPRRRPSAVWRLDEVNYLDLEDGTAGEHPLPPDAHGEVSSRFSRLREGYGYGMAWLH